MTKPDENTIAAAMCGDPDAARECTEAGYAIPCSHCGGESTVERWDITQVYAHCTRCTIHTFPYSKRENALAAWNRRANLRGMMGLMDDKNA